MRRALLAVVLIAASFGGGAFVNGPGLRWVQTNLLGKLGLDDDSDDALSQTPPSIAEADDTPTDSIPPLTKEPSVVSKPAASVGSAADRSTEKPEKPSRYVDSKLPKPIVKKPPEAPSNPDRSLQTAALKPADAPTALAPPATLPSPLDSEENEPDTSVSLPGLGDSPKPLSLNDTKIEEVPPSEPPAKPSADAPKAEAAAHTNDDSTIPVAPTNWSEVRRTLKSLGVTRYGTEGDTAGRVRFHCIIPLAGRKAVGQHFEAEGEDELEAAQSAIRRIGLWRATSTSGDESKSITPP